LTDPTPEAARQIEEAERQTETARARWLDPAWRTAALGWVEEQLARLGLAVIGAIEQPHLRPWSTALSVPTTEGRVWFKAGGPGNRYEAALLDALARWDTRGILAPLAVDVDRGWLLLPDGGTRLREAIDDGPGLVGPAGDRIFDWGDSSVSHPFGTLLVTFRSIASKGLGAGEAERRALVRLRDAYLEPWTDSHSRASLTAAVPLAMRIAIVGRSLSWQGALSGIPPRDHGPWAGYVGGWLMELFEPTPL
jgi:hypothetical protein